MRNPAGAGVTRVLIIACGALAREIGAVIGRAGLDHITLQCLPAISHNPGLDQIAPPGSNAAIRAARGQFERVFVAYAECGTAGALDRVLAEEPGAARLPGPHCYSFYTGVDRFAAAGDADMRTFFLTKISWRGSSRRW